MAMVKPVARLLETWETCSKGKEDADPSSSSETMALQIVKKEPAVTASPTSITAMLGDKPPTELFLPGAVGYETAASCRSAWVVPSRPDDHLAKQKDEGFVSLLKAEPLSLRDALQKGEGAPAASNLISFLAGAHPSLAEIVAIDDVEDESEEA